MVMYGMIYGDNMVHEIWMRYGDNMVHESA